MTDIIEQAARVLCKANGGNPDSTPKSYVNGIATGEVHDPSWVDYVEEAQALADAGLLRELPTREQNALAIQRVMWPLDDCLCYLEFKAADAVLELLEGGNDGT